MQKKTAAIGICFAAVCIIVGIFIWNRHSENVKNNEFNLKSEEVQRINISALPKWFDAFDITDEKQISSVVDYFASLSTAKTKDSQGNYSGGGYHIKIYLKNGTIREFEHSGNMFFIEINRVTYKIPYEEATKFDTIVANIMESNSIKNGEASVNGTVVSIKNEASGRDISCTIKDKDNKTYNINLEASKIIDSTGNGWLILHERDVVRVFYQKDKQKENDFIIASTVYIK